MPLGYGPIIWYKMVQRGGGTADYWDKRRQGEGKYQVFIYLKDIHCYQMVPFY